MRVLVFGASGQVGRAVARDWAAAGWDVVAVSRSALPGLGIPVQAPRASRAETIRALGPFDAVFDPLCFTATEATDLLAEPVGQLVVVSTASVYADDQGRGFETDPALGFPRYPDPILETQSTVPAGEGYSAGKVGMEQALLAAGRSVALLRAGAIHGEGARHPREFWFLKRALDGRAVLPLAQGGRTFFHTTSTRGLASLARLLAQGATGAFNAADPGALDTAAIAQAVAAHVGHHFQIIDPGPRSDEVGASPLSADHPIRLSLAKAEATGWRGPDYLDTLPAYLDWLIPRAGDWQTHFPVFTLYGHDPFDYAAEDAALDLLRPQA